MSECVQIKSQVRANREIRWTGILFQPNLNTITCFNYFIAVHLSEAIKFY